MKKILHSMMGIQRTYWMTLLIIWTMATIAFLMPLGEQSPIVILTTLTVATLVFGYVGWKFILSDSKHIQEDANNLRGSPLALEDIVMGVPYKITHVYTSAGSANCIIEMISLKDDRDYHRHLWRLDPIFSVLKNCVNWSVIFTKEIGEWSQTDIARLPACELKEHKFVVIEEHTDSGGHICIADVRVRSMRIQPEYTASGETKQPAMAGSQGVVPDELEVVAKNS